MGVREVSGRVFHFCIGIFKLSNNIAVLELFGTPEMKRDIIPRLIRCVVFRCFYMALIIRRTVVTHLSPSPRANG
jgi:hypothetical protein